jgi:hypothetical protein
MRPSDFLPGDRAVFHTRWHKERGGFVENKWFASDDKLDLSPEVFRMAGSLPMCGTTSLCLSWEWSKI